MKDRDFSGNCQSDAGIFYKRYYELYDSGSMDIVVLVQLLDLCLQLLCIGSDFIRVMAGDSLRQLRPAWDHQLSWV